jgi:hypothetical protein
MEVSFLKIGVKSLLIQNILRNSREAMLVPPPKMQDGGRYCVSFPKKSHSLLQVFGRLYPYPLDFGAFRYKI